MNILEIFKKTKKTDYYFGLCLKEEGGVGLIIKKTVDGGQLIDLEKFSYSDGWEHILEDVDEVLFHLESKHRLHLEQTIFFVFSHFIDKKNNQIKKPYQTIIKNLAKNLELNPLGFIDCREAIINSIEKKEAMAITTILIELDKNNLDLFIYKTGELVFDKLIGRTDDIVEDLEAIFNELRGKLVLPARIILYNSTNLEDEVNEIISHRWSTDLFVQLPKVEIVSEKEMLHNLVEIFNQQLLKTEPKKIEPAKSIVTETGFLVGEDIAQIDTKIKSEMPIKTKKTTFSFNWIEGFKKIFSDLGGWPKKILLPLGIFIIGLSLFLNEYFLHKAEMSIFLPSLPLKKTVTVTAGIGKDFDIPLKPITKTIKISSTRLATGKKDIGEPARGEVTVYNFDKEKTFSQGTKIEARGIIFSFDEEVKVASASLTSDGSAKLPGKNKVRVTASQIGSEGNLEKNQTFKIEDLDPEIYFAKNEANFSGGSKKQITTVSKQDYLLLEEEVLKKAKNQKQNNWQLSSDERIISQLSTSEITKSNYSKEIGEAANELTLTAEVKIGHYLYQPSRLRKILESLLKKEIKSGYLLDQNKISYQIEQIKEKGNNKYLKILIKSRAIKELDKTRVAKMVLGKTEKEINQILKNNFGVTGYKIKQNQPLPILFLSQRLPFFPRNLRIEIDSL